MKLFFFFFFIFLFYGLLTNFPDNIKKYYRDVGYRQIKNRLHVAGYYLENKKYGRAEIILRELMDKWTDHFIAEEAVFKLIEIEFLRENFKEAKKGYKKYIREFPFGEFVHVAHSRLEEAREKLKANNAPRHGLDLNFPKVKIKKDDINKRRN